MKKVLIYSDCHLFGGSEHAVINLLQTNELKEDIEYSFAYRSHYTYNKKVGELLGNVKHLNLYPLRLFANYGIAAYLRKYISNTFIYKIFYSPFYFAEKIGFYDWYNKRILRKFIGKHNFEVVHINNGGYPGAKSCLLMSSECNKLGIKVILQINNLAKESGDSVLDNIVKDSANIFITASQVAANTLIDILKISIPKVITIPHFVEQKKINKSRSEVCQLIGIKDTSIIIVEVALLQQRKGQVELIIAVYQLTRLLNRKVELVLIGEGENKSSIIDTIHEYRMEDCVHLLGYRDDYIDFVNAADVVTLPSLKDEDMPLILISALSLGKAIVSTKLAGIPEEIEDGVSGILIDPQSENFISELADALLTAYADKEMLSANAIIRYNQIFSKEKFIESYKKLYSSL